jgi:LuxR family transcriptional regulator, maltose regulon positive regulatory protein
MCGMAGAHEADASTLDAGWAELAAGRWGAARTEFERSLSEAESAEAYEGLSWAAWWLDDREEVFDRRRRAYALYRSRGDSAGAARMATWLAADHLDFDGADAVAAGWLGRARRLLDPLPEGPDHGWLAFHEGYVAHARGDTAGACESAVRTARIGREEGIADLEMLGLALEGAALVASARVDEGMRRLDEATATALEGNATIPISSAWACCFLVSACSAVLDFERAAEWCDRIAEFAERYGSRYMLAFCRAEYGAVHLWRGRWSDAEEQLALAIDDFSRSRPAWVGGSLLGLAELRRRQGRWDEASELLDRAGSSSSAQVCRALLALERGDPHGACELLERALRQLPAHSKLRRLPALEVLVRARLGCGDLEDAAGPLEELRELERLIGTPPLRARVDLAAGLIAAARGRHDDARPLLEDAVDRFQASGAPFDAARSRVELAECLAALNRTKDAQREAAAALEALLELGAQPEAERARRALERARGASRPAQGVTPREREVLQLLAEGLTNRQIAERLVLSEHTIHRHVSNLMRKLGVRSRTAAATQAVRYGLLDSIAE